MTLLRSLTSAVEARAAWLTAGDVDAWIASRNGFAREDYRPAEVMRMVAGWACVRLIADSLATMPVSVVMPTDDGLPDRPRGKTLTLLDRPTAVDDLPDFIYASVTSLCTSGNVYAVPVRFDPVGRATQVELLNPNDVKIKRRDGMLIYDVAGYGELGWDELFHRRAFIKPGNPVGMSPTEYAGMAINLGLGAEQYGADFFKGGGMPTGVLKSDQRIDPGEAEQAKGRYRDAMRGNSGPLVLGKGLDYSAVQVDPGKAQAVEAQRWAASQMCRVFGVPPELLGYGESGQSITYANLADRLTGFYRHSLSGWQARIERWLTDLTRPGQHKVTLDPTSMLRADLETRYDAYASAISAGWKSIDEVRAEEGLPARTDLPVPDVPAPDEQAPDDA